MTQVAAIIGAGRERLGNAIARALADDGFRVVLHYNASAEGAKETVAEINQAGGEAVALQADITEEAEVDQLFDDVLARFGRLDGLINTASIWRSIPLEEATAEVVRRSFDVNALGSFLCARRAGLIMAGQEEGGSIINFGDWALERPYRNYAAYFTAKGAVVGLTKSLAVELASRNPRVRVNCIHPGPVLFPKHLDERQKQVLRDATLVKDAHRPDAIMQAVKFLLTNTFVTGVCLPVDGGRTIFAPGSDGYD